MRKIIFLIFLIISFVVFPQGAVGSEKTEEVEPEKIEEEKEEPKKVEPVDIRGDEINYLRKEGKVIAKGNVVMKQKDVMLFCNEAVYDANSQLAYIKGKAKIVKETTTVYGEDFIYDFTTHNAKIVNIEMEDLPLYGEAELGEKLGKEKYLFKKGGHITTCDLDQPHWRLVAKRITMYPGERVVSRNMKLKVGEMPIFWFPYYSHSLKDEYFPVQVYPGKDDMWGKYVLTRWRYDLNAENRGKIHLDWYEERGSGGGITHQMNYGEKFGEALIRYYRMKDELYELDKRNSLEDFHPGRSGVNPKYLRESRWKAQLYYEWDPLPELSIKSEFNKFSDQYFNKDFYYQEYKVNQSNKTYVLLDYSLGGSALSLLTEKRANHFDSQTEYLPQLEYNFYDQELGGSNFYLESDTTLGNLAYQNTAPSDEDDDDDAVRLYSHNVLTYATAIKWLSLKPSIGNYAAFYSKNSFGEEGLFRVGLETGTTLSTKLYKYFDRSFTLFGKKVAMMRHVLTPEIEYSYKHEPTVSNSHVFEFDGKDSLSREHKVKFELRNKLQLKYEDKQVWDFIYFSPSVSYLIDPEGDHSRFPSIDASLEIYPKEGISLTADTTYDIPLERTSRFNLDFTIEGKPRMIGEGEEKEEVKDSLSLGHRYSRQDSSQGTLDLTYHLTPKLRYKCYMRHEYNDNEFQEQSHVLRVDLHCWWLELGVDMSKQREGVKDHLFFIVFTLKAFPDILIDTHSTYNGAKHNY